MGLDFGNTCPDIDKGIREMAQIIEDHFESLIEDICPMLPLETIQEIRDDRRELLYSELESAVENIRSTNEDMRKAADYQINDLEEEVENLKSENESLQEEVDSLEAA